jgi:hypothetical protein
MTNDNLKIAQQYYEGWETSNKELLSVATDLKFTSPDDNFSSAKEFLDQCWQFNGVVFRNKIFLSGDEYVVVKYDFPMPDGTTKPMVEWLTIKEGTITEIQVFYDKS